MSNNPAIAFKALGDPIRLRLFYLLSQQSELCVCHLTDALHLPQSTVSRHLGLMRHAGLVTTRRDGKWMYYRLNGEVAGMLAGMIGQLADDTLLNDARQLTDTLQGFSPPCPSS